MLRTALVSVSLIGFAYGAASQLTEGFEVWTAEGARRLAVMQRPVPSPAAALAGPGLGGYSLADVATGTGHVTIVDFFYTRCNSVCLTLGSSLQQLQQTLSSTAAVNADATRRADVRLLSISFDPAHDGVAQLAQYAARWRADPRFWRVASVPEAAQLQHLLDAFQVTVIADGQGGYDHNAALLVIDSRGRLVGIFDADAPDTALAFARSLLRRGPTT